MSVLCRLPSLEPLEDRIVCSTTWPDPGHLTLSFVPDGTYAANGPSNAFAAFAPFGSSAAWETTILRAFQSWAAVANINLSVTSDDGEALGTTGQAQGDPRFGDIRIAACAMGTSAVATGTPYLLSGSTWSGDVVFNSNFSFTGGPGSYDLYTVALHEAGHVFGLLDNATPSSAMYQTYVGPRSGLDAGDVAAIQALYGARSTASAPPVPLKQAPGTGPAGPFLATDAVSSATDTRTYTFTTDNNSHPAGVDISLRTSGLSLLAAQLSVYDAAGNLVGTTVAADPLHGDLVVHLAQVQPQQRYTVRVSAARPDLFSFGGYQLTVDLYPGAPLGSTAGARGVGQLTGSGPLVVRSAIAPGQADDLYTFQAAPRGDFSAGVDLALEAWGIAVAPPTLTAYDAAGNVLAVATAVDAGGYVHVHLAGVTAGSRYFVRVTTAATNDVGLGAYVLSVGADPGPGMPLVDTSSNPIGTIAGAQNLAPLAGFAPGSRYEVVGTLTPAAPVNFFHVQTAALAAGQTGTLNVTVLAQRPSRLQPTVLVFDANRAPVAATVLSNGGGAFSVQIPLTVSNAGFYIEVTYPGVTAGGNYYLTASSYAVVPDQGWVVGTGTLTAVAPAATGVLTVSQDQLVALTLAVTGTAGQSVQVVIRDAAGNVVLDMTGTAGQPTATDTVYLSAGTYTVSYITQPTASGLLSPVDYQLTADALSDPLGALLTTTTYVQSSSTSTSTASPTTTTTYSQPVAS